MIVNTFIGQDSELVTSVSKGAITGQTLAIGAPDALIELKFDKEANLTPELLRAHADALEAALKESKE